MKMGECVRVSNHISFYIYNTNYIIYNPPSGLQKESKKWEVKRILLKNRINHWKFLIQENLGDTQELMKESIWRISKDE